MAAGRLAAARHSRVIEARSTGKRGGGMARAAILIRRYVRGCLARGSGDGAVVALHA